MFDKNLKINWDQIFLSIFNKSFMFAMVAMMATVVLNAGIWCIMVTLLPYFNINICYNKTGSDVPS